MIRHVFFYEWKKFTSDHVVWRSVMIIVLLTVTALINGNRWYEFEHSTMQQIVQDYETQKDTVRAGMLSYTHPDGIIGIDAPQNPSTFYAGYRVYAMKPLNPLTILSVGQSDLYANYSVFSARDKTRLIQDEEIQNPLHLMTGKFDLTFVIIYILPLLIIAWSYDLYAGEAERKTTTLIRAYGFPLSRYMLYKALFQFLLLSLIFTVTLLVAVAAIKPLLFSVLYILDFFLCCGLAIGYLLCWFTISFFINAWRRNALFNGVMLVSIWVILLLFIPYVISFRANTLYPVPSREKQSLTRRTLAKQIDRKETLQKLVSARPDFNRFRTDTTVQLIFEASHGYPHFVCYQAELEKCCYSMEDSVWHQLQQQEAYCHALRFASPSLLVTHGLHQLAATDTHHYIHYLQQQEQYYQTWRQRLQEQVLLKQPVSPAALNTITPLHWKNDQPYSLPQAGTDSLFLLGCIALMAGTAHIQYKKP